MNTRGRLNAEASIFLGWSPNYPWWSLGCPWWSRLNTLLILQRFRTATLVFLGGALQRVDFLRRHSMLKLVFKIHESIFIDF